MEFYILTNNIKQGPFSLDELASQNITPNTLAWRTGLSDWIPAKDIPELAELLNNLPPETPYQRETIPPMPKTWLTESILITLLCCLPFGIVGIVNATKVESYYISKQYEMAQQASLTAGKWCKIGLISGVVFILLYIMFLLFTVFMGAFA